MSLPSTAWSLVTCHIGDQDIAAVRRGDGSVVQPDVLRPYHGLLDALTDWAALSSALAELDPSGLEPIVGARPVAPVKYPNKLLCVGANYRDHLAEMGSGPDIAAFEPFFFTVPPSTTMVGDGEAIRIPDDPSYAVDWEAELALVIGLGGSDIAPADAVAHIAGYACFSDITARGLLRRRDAVAEPFRWDWASSKGMDTFCPTGAVTPAWMIADPNNLGIRCLVNGVVKQDSNTANFISDVATVVAAASRTWTLEPGDVIATGTPAGVGHPRGERLQPGDEVRVEIDGLATLTNPVVLRQPARSVVPV